MFKAHDDKRRNLARRVGGLEIARLIHVAEIGLARRVGGLEINIDSDGSVYTLARRVGGLEIQP